ncbi:DHA2 family efflux MFS transporter permease subunit [Bacillus sp. B15-48]|uniref:DHA2 family efflux MFS transporter permease subunit n=1 Tax=Bacillus sp. B15-48 TaxID=1548601 RepID=UPI00193FB126|nr:DHA2 family efflux MFS transporter permease subunit [Bacillus sp. B15-48]MBM4760922.1 DHA2 family efflux MFS transporter permease subunit [Bacillus sp. B15-48]
MEQSNNKQTKRPPYGILSVLMIGAFISFLNNTLLNVALPSIMVEFEVGPSIVQWLTTGFMLVNGIMIPTTAFLIQKYSVRKLFLTAMGLFTVGTIVAGFSDFFSVLLLARMLQAAGSAIMMPLLMNVMLVSFPIEKRGTAMGIFGLILMFAPAIGPTLSGLIIEHYQWRALFYFIAPIAVAVFLFGVFMLKDKKEKVDIKLDVFSLLLSSVGFGGLLYGFSAAGNAGWGSPQVYLTIIIGAISLFLFVKRQAKLKEPMLNFDVYKHPMFTLSSVISSVVTMSLFSGMLLLPIFVQTVRGFSPLEAGLMLMPGAILNAFMSPVTGRLFDKFGGRALVVTGLVLTTVPTYYLSILTFETSFTYITVIHTIRMLGMSMVLMPVQTNGLNQLPPRYYPHGTAVNNTLQQVSGAIGTALLITVMSNRQAVYTTQFTESAMKEMTGTPTEAALAELQQQIVMKAMLEGINDAFLVATFISGIALVLAFFMKRAKQAADPLDDKQTEKKIEPEMV